MKKIRLGLIVITMTLGISACKKEVPPTLLVTVVDDYNSSIQGAWVEISVDGADLGLLNANVVDSARTDQYGTATFEFDNTVLVDIAVFKRPSSQTVEDSTSVLLETARSIDDDNLIEKKLVIRSLQ